MKKLTPKQQQFVNEYLIDLNATQAAIRAGYSEKTANEQGARLLAKASVQAAIQEAMKVRQERTEITQDRVLCELAKVAFGDVRVLFNESGNLISIPSLPEEAASMLAGFDATVSGGENPEITKKVKLNDRLRALEMIGRHLGMFTDRIEHTGKDGGAIDIRKVGVLTDEELLIIASGGGSGDSAS